MAKINESIVCAGFGGQGVMVLGKFLANAGMASGMNVTWLPSYGAEVRGGTAHSFIRISTDIISNPVVFSPDTAILMNGPSLDKFEDSLLPGSLLILNSSMCDRAAVRTDMDIVNVPLTGEAMALGNIKVANMIALGIYASKRDIFDTELLFKVVEQMAGARKELVAVNIDAIKRGMAIGSGQ